MELDYIQLQAYLAENKSISMDLDKDIYNSYLYFYHIDCKYRDGSVGCFKFGKSQGPDRVKQQLISLGSRGTFYVVSPGIDGCKRTDPDRPSRTKVGDMEEEILDALAERFERSYQGNEWFKCPQERVREAIEIIVSYMAEFDKDRKRPMRAFGCFPDNNISSADFAEL